MSVLVVFFLVVSMRHPLVSCHQHLSDDFFALEELSFNETRRQKTPIFFGCVSPAWFVECVLLFGRVGRSDEVPNGSQKPGPADVSAGVMTPHKKNLLNLYSLLGKQGRLLVHCIRQCAESWVEKKTNRRML